MRATAFGRGMQPLSAHAWPRRSLSSHPLNLLPVPPIGWTQLEARWQGRAADRVNKNQPLRADCWFIGTKNPNWLEWNTSFQFNRTLPVFTGGTTSPLGRMPYRTIKLKVVASTWRAKTPYVGFKSNSRANPRSTPCFPGMSTWLWGDGTIYLPWAYCIFILQKSIISEELDSRPGFQKSQTWVHGDMVSQNSHRSFLITSADL